MTLTVPRVSVDVRGRDAMLAYRETLGPVGMLTVDSVRVSSKAFECYLHEYGVEPAQHGLPRMHAGLKLSFEAVYRDVKITGMALDIEYTPPVRRVSTFANTDEQVVLQGEL